MEQSSLAAMFERATATRPPTPHLVANSLRAGKRLRRRRRIEAGVAAAAVVGVISAGVPAALGARGHPAPPAQRPVRPETLYSASFAGEVTPIRVATGVAGRTIRIPQVSADPYPMAVTPNGRAIYTTSGQGTLTPIYTATDTAGRPIRVSSHILGNVVIAPNGRTAYVVQTDAGVIPVNLVTRKPGKLIKISQADEIAITPDGRTLYVVREGVNDIVPVRTSTNATLKPIHLPVPASASSTISIARNGRTAYVFSAAGEIFSGAWVTPISIATNSTRRPIELSGYALHFLLAPDGTAAYVFEQTRPTPTTVANEIAPVDLTSGTVGKLIRLPGRQGPFAMALLLTPNGKTLYVTGGDSGKTVTPIDTATGKLSRPIRLAYTAYTVIAPVISPDGSTVYIVGPASARANRWDVMPIRTATNTAGRPIRVAEEPVAMVITR
jgi:DNA-binding beta-propeller fold protein YncE